MGEDAIEAGGRGAHTVIGTYLGWLDCSQCGNCIEVCPTGTLLDATYRHQTRPWELAQTISTCNFCSDGCQMSLGSRGGEVMRVVARDRYVNGINGEFLCVKGRFAHPFINHEARIRTPMIRYKKGGKLIPATWDEAIRHVAERLDTVANDHGRNAIGVVGSPRLTNEALYVLRKFATELVGTENYTTTDRFSLQSFLQQSRRAARNSSRHSLREDDRSDRRRSERVAATDRQADSTGSEKWRRDDSCSSIQFRFACANRRRIFCTSDRELKTRSCSRLLIQRTMHSRRRKPVSKRVRSTRHDRSSQTRPATW